jgi:hypothetical protein
MTSRKSTRFDNDDLPVTAKTQDIFVKHRYLPWQHRPSSLSEYRFLFLLRLFTGYTIIATIGTVVFAIGVVWIIEATDEAPIGGDGFAYIFTILALILALYLPKKSEILVTIRKSTNIIQQQMCEGMGVDKSIAARTDIQNQIIEVVQDLQMHSTFHSAEHIKKKLRMNSREHFTSLSEEKQTKIMSVIVDHINVIISMRPSYVEVYMETFINFANFVNMTAFYPILLREKLDSNWLWMPIASIICFVSFALLQTLFILQYQIAAYGVLSLPL